MQSRLAFIKKRQALRLLSEQSNASDIVVLWTETSGGTLNAGTGAMEGGTEAVLSGTMRGRGHIEPGTTVERTFAEIQAGDLILDVDAEPEIALYPGQSASGVRSLDEVAAWHPRFQFGGAFYVQKELGAELAAKWDAIVRNRKLHRTILLRESR